MWFVSIGSVCRGEVREFVEARIEAGTGGRSSAAALNLSPMPPCRQAPAVHQFTVRSLP
jgi:hypothetical protein